MVDEVPISAKKTRLGSFFRLLTNPIPKESLSKLHKHAICCKTNGWNMGSLREVSSALQARRREHAGDRATNFGENVSFRCSRAPTTTCGGPPPSRREAGATSSLYILLNATQRCHFVISLTPEHTVRGSGYFHISDALLFGAPKGDAPYGDETKKPITRAFFSRKKNGAIILFALQFA